MSYQNVARGCHAWQSSTSQWSKGSTVQEDAEGATSGDPTKDYGFHTNYEPYPWWTVDLGKVYEIHEIHIYNRRGVREIQARASPLLVELSADGQSWFEFYKTDPNLVFGTGNDGGSPLVCVAEKTQRAQYVKITVLKDGAILHLAEVEVYAEATKAETVEPAISTIASADPEIRPSAPKPDTKHSGWLSFLGW